MAGEPADRHEMSGAERHARAAVAAVAHVAVRFGSVLLGLLFLTAAGLILLLSQTVVGRDLAAGLVEDLLKEAL